MYRTAITVADDTRARLFMYGRPRDPSGPQEPLAEIATFEAKHTTDDFARSIGRVVDQLIDEAGVSRLVLWATPPMLAALRGVLRPRHDVVVEERARTAAEVR